VHGGAAAVLAVVLTALFAVARLHLRAAGRGQRLEKAVEKAGPGAPCSLSGQSVECGVKSVPLSAPVTGKSPSCTAEVPKKKHDSTVVVGGCEPCSDQPRAAARRTSKAQRRPAADASVQQATLNGRSPEQSSVSAASKTVECDSAASSSEAKQSTVWSGSQNMRCMDVDIRWHPASGSGGEDKWTISEDGACCAQCNTAASASSSAPAQLESPSGRCVVGGWRLASPVAKP
jgi:hypothetical protein